MIAYVKNENGWLEPRKVQFFSISSACTTIYFEKKESEEDADKSNSQSYYNSDSNVLFSEDDGATIKLETVTSVIRRFIAANHHETTCE